MKPDENIRKAALEQAKRLKESVGGEKGFKGMRFPLPFDGWFINIDYKGDCKELVYEKDGIVAHYNP